jgi:orotidine-5'-phosphate decarboxylase
MTREELFKNIQKKKSFLCVGLDTDIQKIPKFLLDSEDPIFAFNKRIIDATKDYCISYKPNTAFYEAMGAKGWETLKKTLDYIPKDCFTIADAKRGDIGNTSGLYARAFFEELGADSVTVAPYMGEDSVTPFLAYPGKWTIVLALTSNQGALDFQTQELKESGDFLFQKVLKKTSQWGTADNMMYVVGATRAHELEKVRAIVPDNFLLIPGVGAQGGSMSDVFQYGANAQCGLLINASRSIIYASNGEDFADKAREEAQKMQAEMEILLQAKGLI